ncbi:MAG: hypothetical protein ABS934_10070 [Psychrobacillus sp.]
MSAINDKESYSINRKKIEDLFEDYNEDYTMIQIIEENILNSAEGFLFYYLHLSNKIDFERDSSFQVLIDFLRDDLHYSATIDEIRLLIDEKFLFIKYIDIYHNYNSDSGKADSP